MFNRKREVEKADLLGQRLVGGVTEIAVVFTGELAKIDGDLKLRQHVRPEQLIIEWTVFYLHLVDRMAFAHFGPAKRDIFGDRLMNAVLGELCLPLAPRRHIYAHQRDQPRLSALR